MSLVLAQAGERSFGPWLCCSPRPTALEAPSALVLLSEELFLRGQRRQRGGRSGPASLIWLLTACPGQALGSPGGSSWLSSV